MKRIDEVSDVVILFSKFFEESAKGGDVDSVRQEIVLKAKAIKPACDHDKLVKETAAKFADLKIEA